MTSTPAAKHTPTRGQMVAAAVCILGALVLLHFFGNATRGYVKTASMFGWWISQWLDPNAESEHGWLILGLSGWVLWRNFRIADCGLRIAETPKTDTENRKLETEEAKPDTGNRRPETGGGKLETGNRRPESGDLKPETGNRKPESEIRTAETEDDSQERGRASRRTDGASESPAFPVSGLRSPVLARPQSAIRDPQSEALLPAIIAMLCGLLLHAAGFAAQQTRLSIIAFLVFTWGALRLAGGRRWGDAAMFPLGFMVFAIPISVLDEVGLPLRMWVTSAGERIAHLAGIDVVRSGTQLVAPDGRFNYDVAAPCSGVRSLMALTALSVLIGYLNFRSWWRRVLVFGVCFPLVYLGNVTRIVAIVFAAQAGGPEWGDRAHVIMGYGVFVIVLGGILMSVAVIHRWWPEVPQSVRHLLDDKHGCHLMNDKGTRAAAEGGPADGAMPAVPSGPGFEDPIRNEASNLGAPRRAGRALIGGTMVVAVLALAEMFFLHRLREMPPRGRVGVVLAEDGLNPIELPPFLGTEWIGQRAEVSPAERDILPADTGFSRKNYAFVADRTRDVFLSIVLSGRDRTSIHRPELCLVGQGWTIEGATQQAFRYPAQTAGGDFRATVLRVRREIPSARGKVVVPQLVAYWFVGGDTVQPSHWGRFVRDAWYRVTRARADRWAYILMQTDARDGEAAALARMQTVLDGTLPVFQKTLPASTR